MGGRASGVRGAQLCNKTEKPRTIEITDRKLKCRKNGNKGNKELGRKRIGGKRRNNNV
jgi:hypothetical protein